MKPAFFLLRLISLLHLALALCSGSGDFQFAYHGFTGTNLTLDGNATVMPDGILVLTSRKTNLKGHAFFPAPLQFRTSPDGTARSFSAAFVFAIISDYTDFCAHGMAFIVSPTKNFTTALPVGYLALLNVQNNGNTTNHLFAVELDTVQNTDFQDVNANHVGINVNNLHSLQSSPTSYYDDGNNGVFKNLTLFSREAMQVWVDYDGNTGQIDVALAPIKVAKPRKPLVSAKHLRYAQLLEDWELEFGPHRFSYKDLYHATNGFKSKHLLGTGLYGQVYKGVFRKSRLEVAVKKVSHESRQGMKEFISEFVTIGRLRNRNLVQLHGYCRRKGELLLEDKPLRDWSQRFHIIRGVASGLLYIHEKWEKVVIHRDIKASNVLLDHQMNGCLGDFGLSRLYDHGTDPQTTHVVGTMGYLAPELIWTGKASKLTDVFTFGAFLLEITCGQRPVNDDSGRYNQEMLVDWVLDHFKKGSLNETVDLRLQGDCNTDEACRVLKLGLLCSHPSANLRPGMRQVMQYLDGDTPLPDLTSTNMSFSTMALMQNEGFDSYPMSYPSSAATIGTVSFLLGGR
ncbi:hypothetical protein OsJ_23769 [Oryza sativa Japonica Group]|uniref:non-specific serine/threonine protein kinase n=1 Tax=Oryza sativa subsp. japonica TaxID=39947 RepID=B9FWI1_ORYSJ|nr:hypothetical protein OsJ_23769 [Oryza sativa Japonica Group]